MYEKHLENQAAYLGGSLNLPSGASYPVTTPADVDDWVAGGGDVLMVATNALELLAKYSRDKCTTSAQKN